MIILNERWIRTLTKHSQTLSCFQWNDSDVKMSLDARTRICLWIQALKRWLTDGGLSFLHLTHVGTTPYSKQRHCDITIKLSLHYIQDNFFLQKCWWSPYRQKSPYHQAEHKPNVKPPRNDSYQISKRSAHNCRRSSVLKKSLRIKQPNK